MNWEMRGGDNEKKREEPTVGMKVETDKIKLKQGLNGPLQICW